MARRLILPHPTLTAVRAMYAGSRSLMHILIPGFVVQILLMMTSLAVVVPRVMTAPHCISTAFPVEIIVYTYVPLEVFTISSDDEADILPSSISSIIFEGILFGLTLHKYLHARKEGWGERSLLNLLVRDSVWAFLLVLSMYAALFVVVPLTDAHFNNPTVAMMANTLFFTLAPATLAALGFPYVSAFHRVLSTSRSPGITDGFLQYSVHWCVFELLHCKPHIFPLYLMLTRL